MLKAVVATRLVNRGAWMAGAGLVALMLGGCTVGYQADVRNDTAQPIGVAIIRADASGQSNNLAVQRIAPKSRGKLVRNGVPHDMKVYLEADAIGNPGWPVQLDLKTGLTVVRVTQDGDVPTGKLRMERIEGE